MSIQIRGCSVIFDDKDIGILVGPDRIVMNLSDRAKEMLVKEFIDVEYISSITEDEVQELFKMSNDIYQVRPMRSVHR